MKLITTILLIALLAFTAKTQVYADAIANSVGTFAISNPDMDCDYAIIHEGSVICITEAPTGITGYYHYVVSSWEFPIHSVKGAIWCINNKQPRAVRGMVTNNDYPIVEVNSILPLQVFVRGMINELTEYQPRP